MGTEGATLPPDEIKASDTATEPASTGTKKVRGLELSDITFRIGSTTNPEKTRNRDGKVEAMPNQEKPLIEEVRADFKEYMKGHVHRLIRLQETLDEAQFDQLFGADGDHFYDRELFNKLTKQKKEGSQTKGKEIDTEQLDALMATNRGMGIAYAVRQAEFDLEAAGDAVYVAINPDNPPPGTIDGEEIPKGGEGFIRKTVDRFGRYLARPSNATNGRPRNGEPETNQDRIVRNTRLSALAALGGSALGALEGGREYLINNVHALDTSTMSGLVAGIGMVGIGRAIQNSRRSGETLNVVECAKALQTLAGDPVPPTQPGAQINRQPNMAEVTWLKEFAGLDPRDFEVYQTPDGNEAVRVKQDRRPESIIDSETRRNRLIGHAEALIAFQKATSVPQEQRTPGDMNAMYGDSPNFTQSGLDIDQRADRYFDINRGGELDTNGEARERLVAGTADQWEINPDFLSNGAELDVHGNMERYRAAHRRAIVDEIDFAFKEISDGKTDFRGELVGQIDTKIENSGINSPANQARMEELNREIGADGNSGLIGGDRSELQRLSASFEQFRQAEQKIADANRSRDSLARRVQRPGPPPTPVTADELRQALESVGQTQATSNVSILIEGVPFRNIQERQQELDARIDAQLNSPTGWRSRNPEPIEPTLVPITGTGRQVEESRAQAQAQYQEQMKNFQVLRDKYQEREEKEIARLKEQTGNKKDQAAIDDAAAKLQKMVENLDTYEETRKTEQKNLASRSPDNVIRRDSQAAIRDISRARDIINEGAAAVPGNLDRNDYGTQPFDELLRRINAGNAADPTFGWPAEDNVNPDNRALVERAMVDARTTQPSPEFAAATDEAVWNIPEYDLLTMDTPAIRALMDERAAAIGQTVPDDTQINDIRTLARTRYGQRVTAFNNITNERETAQRTASRERERLVRQNEAGHVAPELKAAKRLVGRYDAIGEAITRVDMDQLLDPAVIDRTQRADANAYAPYENGETRAYVQMMQLMFDHSFEEDAQYQDNRGPEAAFRRNQQLISQTQLYELLNDHFNLGAADFQGAVNMLYDRFHGTAASGRTNRNLGAEQLRNFFTEIVIYGRDIPGGGVDGGLVKQRVRTL